MTMKKINKCCVAVLLGLVLLGVKHYLDTRAGALESGDTWLTFWYVILFVICLAGAGGLGYLLYSGRKLEYVFVAAGLLYGGLYLCVLPPLSAPDEVSHYISAYQLSSHLLGQPANYKDGHVLVRAEDWFLEDIHGEYRHKVDDGDLVAVHQNETDGDVLGQTLTEETYRLIHEIGFSHEEPGTAGGAAASDADTGTGMAVSTYPPIITTPLGHLPQALGIALARLLGMNCLGLAYMGRLWNLLFYVGLTFLAMKKLPFGREVLFGVALLPMTLHLTGSMSYDTVILALAFYFTAVVLDLAYAREKVRVRDVLTLMAVMAVLGPCKMVYAVLMGLCLLIPVRRFGGWRNYLLSAAAVLAAFVIAMVLVNSRTIISYATDTNSYVGWAGEAGYSFRQLLSSPGLVLTMLYNTVIWQAEYYHLTMIGAYLGNLDAVLDVPYLIVMLFSLGLLGLSFRKPGETLKIGKGQRILIWLVCLGCVLATMFSMLLAWTPVSSRVISGVQGRYFLPFLPILLMSIKNRFVVLTKNRERTILFLMCAANSYILFRLFSVVSMRL